MGYRYPSPDTLPPLQRMEARDPPTRAAQASRSSHVFGEDFRAPRIPRAWAVRDDEDCTAAEETKEVTRVALQRVSVRQGCGSYCRAVVCFFLTCLWC